MIGREKYPLRGRWEKDREASVAYQVEHGSTSVFRCGAALAISSIANMTAPDGSDDVIPQWHVSVSEGGRRPSRKLIERVRRDFGMEQAEVDNHHPGVAVHLLLCVAPDRRVACECKAGEKVVTEPDGYQWSNDPAACRGCQYQVAFGRPCPIHASSRSE